MPWADLLKLTYFYIDPPYNPEESNYLYGFIRFSETHVDLSGNSRLKTTLKPCAYDFANSRNQFN